MIHGVKKYLETFYYTTWLYGKCRSYVQPWISTSFNTNEIVPNLFLGDIASAYNKEELKRLGITHIVTAILGVNPIFPDDFIYKNIPLRDIPGERIGTHFIKSNEYISKALGNGGKVLVHCIQGVSRSATLVAAYLMYEYGLTCEAAIKLLQRKRACVDPNNGFRQQLETFQNDFMQGKDIEASIQNTDFLNKKTGKWLKRRNSI